MPTVETIRSTNQVSIDAIWRSWGDLTRFHLSSRIAMQREHDVWRSIQAHSSKPIEISLPPSVGSEYLQGQAARAPRGDRVAIDPRGSCTRAVVVTRRVARPNRVGRMTSARWKIGTRTRCPELPSALEDCRRAWRTGRVVRGAELCRPRTLRVDLADGERVAAAGGSRHKPGEIVDLGDAGNAEVPIVSPRPDEAVWTPTVQLVARSTDGRVADPNVLLEGWTRPGVTADQTP